MANHSTPKNAENCTKENKFLLRMCSCDVIIVEDIDKNGTDDDAIFCEGTCQVWIHRKCMSMSEVVYEI